MKLTTVALVADVALLRGGKRELPQTRANCHKLRRRVLMGAVDLVRVLMADCV